MAPSWHEPVQEPNAVDECGPSRVGAQAGSLVAETPGACTVRPSLGDELHRQTQIRRQNPISLDTAMGGRTRKYEQFVLVGGDMEPDIRRPADDGKASKTVVDATHTFVLDGNEHPR